MPIPRPLDGVARPRSRFALALALCAAGAGGGAIVSAQQRSPRGAPVHPVSGDASVGLWVSATPLEDGRQLLLVIDPAGKNVAVYHVDGTTGALVLRSTRNITFDLLVPEFNAQDPRPATLKTLLESGADSLPAGGRNSP